MCLYWPCSYEREGSLLDLKLHLIRHPVEARGVNVSGSLLLVVLQVVFDDFRSDTDDVLAFPVLDEVQGLQSGDDIVRLDGSHGADVFDGEIPLVLS